MENKEESRPLFPRLLGGAFGEVLESELIRSKKKATKNKNQAMMVRFPLLTPWSRVGIMPNWGCGELDVREEGLLIPVRALQPIDKTPISQYKREQLSITTSFSEMFSRTYDKPIYLSSYNKNILRLLKSLSERHSLSGWYIKHELTSFQEGQVDNPVFLEARIYGIDCLLGAFNRKRNEAVVVEVLARDMKYPRFMSNTYILGLRRDYIDHLDGVDVPRMKVPIVPDVFTNLHRYLYTPTEYQAYKEKRDITKKKIEEEKKKLREMGKKAAIPADTGGFMPPGNITFTGTANTATISIATQTKENQ